ncbi:MAG: ABC transporter permease [Dehalococcoidia bacterium]
MSTSFREAFRELLASWTGRVGVGLFLFLVGISLYVLATYPLDFGKQWGDPKQWEDNPQAVPPGWITLFDRGRVKHTILDENTPSEVRGEGGRHVTLYRVPISYDFDEFPTFLSITLRQVTYQTRPPLITVLLDRPDGKEMLLLRHLVRGPREGEELPITRYSETPFRVSLSSDENVLSNIDSFYRREYGLRLPQRKLQGLLDQAIFGIPSGQDATPFQVLRGDYQVIVEFTAFDEGDSLDSFRFVVGGSTFGALGTDNLGRDLAKGLLFGFPIALFIGLMASILTTTIGTILGITSGYIGGKTDTIIQRFADVVANVPLLPLLILLVFILRDRPYKLIYIILLLVAFSWPGLTILIRSMVLQLKTGQFVEASLSLGASRWRIMFKHIFPQTAPFVFSQMIFFVPSAILAEASLSFLGLGDPSMLTWGQILEAAFRTGAVFVGYWWWVLPPGLLIVLTAVTFVFLALGMERVVNPRLRSMV